MAEVTPHDLRMSLGTARVRAEIHHHFRLVVWSPSSHSVALDILVQILTGVQLRAVGRQGEDLDLSRAILQPAPDRRGFMHRMPIPDQEDLLLRLTDQAPQKA